MRNKLLSIGLVIGMIMTLFTGCSTPSETTDTTSANTVDTTEALEQETNEVVTDATKELGDVKAPEDTKVVYLAMSLEGDFFVLLDDMFKTKFEEYGYQYESFSANMDALTQIEQLENAVANGADLILTWAVEGNALTDACQRAMDQGVAVFAYAMDTKARTCFRGTDNAAMGAALADMAIEWVDETFKDAEDESVNAIILGSIASAEDTLRFESVKSQIAANSKIKVLEAVGGEPSVIEGQNVTENMFQKYDDIDLIICCGGETSIGACAYVTSESSPISDYEQFGVFGSETSAEQAEYMKLGLLKGTITTGNLNNSLQIGVDECNKILSGQEHKTELPIDPVPCTMENLAEFGY